jgi:hypothetical protein
MSTWLPAIFVGEDRVVAFARQIIYDLRRGGANVILSLGFVSAV